MLTEGMSGQKFIADLTAKIERLKEELDTERMRLAACGVIALSNTPDSAKQARQMKYEYWSASCADVADAVDREMALRDKLAECQAREAKLREALSTTLTFAGDVAGSASWWEDVWEAGGYEGIQYEHQDDTALREYRKQVLLEAAGRLDPDDAVSGSYRSWLRKLAEEA